MKYTQEDLELAFKNDNFSLAGNCIEAGVKITPKIAKWHEFIQHLIRERKPDLILKLVKAGADPSHLYIPHDGLFEEYFREGSLFDIASYLGWHDVVKEILEQRGPEKNKNNPENNSAFRFAVTKRGDYIDEEARNKQKVAKLIVKHDPNAINRAMFKNQEGLTVNCLTIFQAVYNGNLEAVKLILKQPEHDKIWKSKAIITKNFKHPTTIAQCAYRQGYFEILGLLVEYGGNTKGIHNKIISLVKENKFDDAKKYKEALDIKILSSKCRSAILDFVTKNKIRLTVYELLEDENLDKLHVHYGLEGLYKLAGIDFENNDKQSHLKKDEKNDEKNDEQSHLDAYCIYAMSVACKLARDPRTSDKADRIREAIGKFTPHADEITAALLNNGHDNSSHTLYTAFFAWKRNSQTYQEVERIPENIRTYFKIK